MFGAKILFAADGKIQNYLENCRMGNDRSEVDYSILNFEEITRDISNNRFFVDIAPLFNAAEKEGLPDGNEKKKGAGNYQRSQFGSVMGPNGIVMVSGVPHLNCKGCGGLTTTHGTKSHPEWAKNPATFQLAADQNRTTWEIR